MLNDIVIARMQPVVDAIDRLTAAVAENNRLLALRLQSVDGLTTHAVAATPKDLADTHVSYNDPEWLDALERIEQAKGRPLNEDEESQAWAAWQAINKDDEKTV